MTSISASTKHLVKPQVAPAPAPAKGLTVVAPPSASASSLAKISVPSSSSATPTLKGVAAKLQGLTLAGDAQLSSLRDAPLATQRQTVLDLLHKVLGLTSSIPLDGPPVSAADAARARAASAADLAGATKVLGAHYALKQLGVHKSLKQSIESDSTPPSAQEGALLAVRALAERCGDAAEPYILPLLGGCLALTGSSSLAVREAAEDCCRALVDLANPLSAGLVLPVFFKAFEHPDWRVKTCSLDRVAHFAQVSPEDIALHLPLAIPRVTPLVWDTKLQVSKAANACLLSICGTNANPDVKHAIPAVVAAIVKPADTVKAIEKLMHTTFICPVDAGTLAILCPVLSRGLKEKLTNHKRMASVVIENMSKLVDSPSAVAPFGPLLVPELKRVCDNVQFEEIRDVALNALKSLTKALGHSSVEEATAAYAAMMEEESRRIEDEQRAIEAERKALEDKKKKEEEEELAERKLFKQAMEATRILEKLEEEKDEKAKADAAKQKELAKKNVKTGDGKCQACGLKKCKKDCLFRS